jgi:hypothetical protein
MAEGKDVISLEDELEQLLAICFKTILEEGVIKYDRRAGTLGAELAFLVAISKSAKSKYEKLLKEVSKLPPKHALRKKYYDFLLLANAVWSA